MRLLNITNRYYIAIALVLLLISSAFLAYRVLYVVDREISEHLIFEKLEVEKELTRQKDLQGIHFIFGDRIEVEPIDSITTYRVSLRDTMIFDAYEEGEVPFRILKYQQYIDGEGYLISIQKRLTESEDLGQGVFTTLVLVAIDIIACFYFLNRWFSSNIWRPFYRAINALKNFDLQKGGRVVFQRSNIDEFNTLNAELTKLTDKVTRDYRNLREFTENMSHETQTPLAIIRSKLELLLQSDNLTSEQIGHIRSTLDSVNRLSKMNKSLITLTRIENEQFAEEGILVFGDLIKRHLEDLDMFITTRELHVHSEIDPTVKLKMSQHLADMLLSNLLSNAIKYNQIGGELNVMLSSQRLVVSNNGSPLSIPGEQIFERFKKGDLPDSVGLGLAIVKRICDHYGFDIQYSYINQLHTFDVRFPPNRAIS